METVSWKEFNGYTYLYINYRKKSDEEIFNSVVKITDMVLVQEPLSTRIMVDVTGVKGSYEAYLSVREIAKNSQPYIHKSTIVGLRGYVRVLYSAYRLYTKSKAITFKTFEEGLDYLCS